MDSGGRYSVGVGESDEVRVVKGCSHESPVEFISLNALQNSPCIVIKDENDWVYTVLNGGSKLLDVILETAVTGDN